MKISLCGSAPSSAHLAPFEDKSWDAYREGLPDPANIGVMWPTQFREEEWEIWGCSPGLLGSARRVTRWFEVHRWEPGQTWFQPAYLSFLREFRGPVYVGGQGIPKEDIPNQVLYPTELVVQEFTSYFLTSSLALMQALAIMEIEEYRRQNPDHDQSEDTIAMFGVDMAASEEWADQRPGCIYFILEALKRNIGVYVPPESCLLIPKPIYGIREWDHKYIKMQARARELNDRRNQLQRQVSDGQAGLNQLQGAITDLGYYADTLISHYDLPAGQVIRLPGKSASLVGRVAEPPRGQAVSYRGKGKRSSKKSGNGALAAEPRLAE
jgi:hypothetical protein